MVPLTSDNSKEPTLFNGTVMENVSAGLLGTSLAKCSEHERRKLVEEACVAAYADEFIRELPHVSPDISRRSVSTHFVRGLILRSEKEGAGFQEAKNNESPSLAPSSQIQRFFYWMKRPAR